MRGRGKQFTAHNGGAGKIVRAYRRYQKTFIPRSWNWASLASSGGSCSSPASHPGFFSSQTGVSLRQGLWKALPTVSRNRLGLFFSTQLRLSLTHTPSGHKEVPFCCESRGQRPIFHGPQKSLSASAPRPCPHQASTPARPGGAHTLTSSRGRRPALPTAAPVFHFQFATPELRRRLGKEIWERQDNSQRIQAQQSWVRVFTDASYLKASGTSVPGTPWPAAQHKPP